MARSWLMTAIAGAGAWLGACGGPTDPCFFIEPPSGTYQSRLDAVVGQGIGGVSATSIPEADGTFHVLLKFRIKCAAPTTTFLVQRSPDVGRALGADRICQRAQGLPPWGPGDPPAPTFLTFPRQDGPTGPVTLTTDANGEGSLAFEFRSSALHRDDQFDVQMRLVDSEASPASDLRSGCMTIDVK